MAHAGDQSDIEQLTCLAAAGNRAAIEALLLHFHDPLLRFIHKHASRCRSAGLTPDDLLQETMTAAFRGMGGVTLADSRAFFGWLKVIARNRLSNLVEARQAKKRGGGRAAVRHASALHATATSIFASIAGPDPTPSLIARRNEAVKVIAATLSTLDPQQRRVIEMRFQDGLTNEQIAAREGKNAGAIKMLMHRGIKHLRARIDRDFCEIS